MTYKRHRSTSTFISAIILVVVIVIGIVVMIQPLIIPPSEVELLVGNAGGILALRFPVAQHKHRDQIVARHWPGDETIRVARYSVDRDPEEDVTIMELTEEEWEPVAALIRDWCRDPPPFQKAPEGGEPFYDVGYYCGSDRRAQIPPDELPPALAHLIEMVPSPTCDDPFCGWQE